MIRVRNIKLLIEEETKDNLLKKVFKKLRINNIDSYKIVKKSIDARDQSNIKFIYSVYANINNYSRRKYDKNIVETNEYKLNYLPSLKVDSKAKIAIISVQDILGLDDSARINIPGIDIDENWSWKLNDFEDFKERIKDF